MSRTSLHPLFLKFAVFAAMTGFSATLLGAEKPVTVSEDNSSLTLDNGIVTAQVAKRSGDLISLKYHGLETLDNVTQRQPGYWSHNAARGRPVARITIDPRTNHGERGEVSVKGISNGNPMAAVRAAVSLLTSKSVMRSAAAIRAFTPIPFSATPQIIPRPQSAKRVFAPSSTTASSTG